MKRIQAIRSGTLAAAFIATLSISGWVSAQSAAAQTVMLQTTEVTATPIDISVVVPLTFGIEAQSPLDDQNIYQRQFKFKGKANQLMTITTAVLTGNMSLNVYVEDQAGGQIANVSGKFITTSQFTLKLPQDGNYIITVNHADPGSGDFQAGTFSVVAAPAVQGESASGPKSQPTAPATAAATTPAS